MNERVLICYGVMSIVIAMIDILLAAKSFEKNKKIGKYLGSACVWAALVDLSYLISIISENYRRMSLMSSIYFVSIDYMLVCLLHFTIFFTKRKLSKWGKTAVGISWIYAGVELIIFAVNPFLEIAIGYERRETFIAKYSYQMKPLYWIHLLFTYVLVISILVLLIRKMQQIPREYRVQHFYMVSGILTIVFVNAVFLFLPGESIFNLLDYSICGYSLAAILLYWSCFNYSTHGMLNRLKTQIFESIDQGIVLFDYDDNLILHNEQADHLLGGVPGKECALLDDFLKHYGISLDSEIEAESLSLQCYANISGEEHPLRCDIRILENEKEQKLGRLFVFSDAAMETDLLTGFQEWESFQRFIQSGKDHFFSATGVAVCDINSLSVINSTLGNIAGNQKIKMLADTMRQYFPPNTYYVRGMEANLIALCIHSDEVQMQKYMTQVKEHFSGNIQYAVSVANEAVPNILNAIQTATAAMRAKKLLDRESMHSEMLTSLIQALQECDSDTEHHVRRTQILGAELGKRIELTDMQQSQLSLLCLLHDIGKIGIPLEILNKPAKLSPEEWKILQSHTEKGYEIAKSNHELRGIAEEIRHHHERWDGKGYPDGLSCETIPLLSRVIAVVDAFDAMTNNRSYRQARSASAAMKELKNCAGTQFDPYIVAEFLRMLKEDNMIETVEEEPEGSLDVQEVGSTASRERFGSEKGYSVHSVPFSRYLLDSTLKIVDADENFEKITGYTPEEIREGKVYQTDLIPEEERTEYLCLTNAGLAKNGLAFQEHKLRRKDGSDVYVFCFGRVYYDSAVRSERSEIIITDVTSTYSMKMMAEAEQSKAQIKLRYWERTYRKDSLTGLLNHAAFRSDVELKILKGMSKIMMLMIDVDKFKEYNDTFGHHKGDNYLILIAQTLMNSLRKEDRACRMGGDEFAAMIFFDKETKEEQMLERAQQIFDRINMTIQSTEGGTGISMGVMLAAPKQTFNEMYEEADQALYQAKKKGRGKLVAADRWASNGQG